MEDEKPRFHYNCLEFRQAKLAFKSMERQTAADMKSTLFPPMLAATSPPNNNCEETFTQSFPTGTLHHSQDEAAAHHNTMMQSPTTSFDLVVEPTNSQEDEETCGAAGTPILAQKNVATLIYPPAFASDFSNNFQTRSMLKMDRANKQQRKMQQGFDQHQAMPNQIPKIIFSSMGTTTVMPVEEQLAFQSHQQSHALTGATNQFATYCIPVRQLVAQQPMQQFNQIGQN